MKTSRSRPKNASTICTPNRRFSRPWAAKTTPRRSSTRPWRKPALSNFTSTAASCKARRSRKRHSLFTAPTRKSIPTIGRRTSVWPAFTAARANTTKPSKRCRALWQACPMTPTDRTWRNILSDYSPRRTSTANPEMFRSENGPARKLAHLNLQDCSPPSPHSASIHPHHLLTSLAAKRLSKLWHVRNHVIDAEDGERVRVGSNEHTRYL